MKKILSGVSVLLTGAILYLSLCTAASYLGLIDGWDERTKQISDPLALIPLRVSGYTTIYKGLRNSNPM